MNIDFNGNMSFLVSGKNVDNNKLLKMGDTEVLLVFCIFNSCVTKTFRRGYIQYYYEYAKK